METRNIPYKLVLAGSPLSFAEWAAKENLEMTVTERRSSEQGRRFYAAFDHTQTVGGVMLTGNGGTPADAIQDYRMNIAGNTLVIRSIGPSRREIIVPPYWADDEQWNDLLSDQTEAGAK